jgi:hypothetical protein
MVGNRVAKAPFAHTVPQSYGFPPNFPLQKSLLAKGRGHAQKPCFFFQEKNRKNMTPPLAVSKKASTFASQ